MTALGNRLDGISAEDSVARIYERGGARVTERRWRGPSGEIDMIAETGGTLCFVEVKKSKSHSAAALRVSKAQILRIQAAAMEYLSARSLSLDTDMRFDLALVDRTGAVDVVENALM